MRQLGQIQSRLDERFVQQSSDDSGAGFGSPLTGSEPQVEGSEGKPLQFILDRSTFPLVEQLELFEKICRAVNTAHQRGYVLHNLHPWTLRIYGEGETCIVDFGPVRSVLEAASEESPGRAMVLGNVDLGMQALKELRWLSPEEAAGGTEATEIRSNVYVLGLIFYYVLTKRFPYFVVGSAQDVRESILYAQPLKPSTYVVDLDPRLDSMAMKCLHKSPEGRYPNAGELSLDVRRFLDGCSVHAERLGLFQVARNYRWTRGLALAVLLVAGVCLLAYGLWILAK